MGKLCTPRSVTAESPLLRYSDAIPGCSRVARRLHFGVYELDRNTMELRKPGVLIG